MIEVPVTELARRICVRTHPMYNTVGARIPCGIHTQEAQRLISLTQPGGTVALRVVIEARRENGLPIPGIPESEPTTVATGANG
jgi:hypothetical protein